MSNPSTCYLLIAPAEEDRSSRHYSEEKCRMSNEEEVADLVIPLRSWMEIEAKKTPLMDPKSSKESIIRKTTVAYGIVELLLRSDDNDKTLEQDIFKIDNFAVHVSKKSPPEQHRQPWDDIMGISMIHPALVLSIEEPAYLDCLLEPEEKQGHWGRYLEVEQMVTSAMPEEENSPDAVAAAASGEDPKDKERNCDPRCHYSVGKLLYELFANETLPEDSSLAVGAPTSTAAATEERVPKRAKTSNLLPPHAKGEGGNLIKAELPFQIPAIVRMQQLGIPASICLMTNNLLESALSLRGNDDQSSDDAYKSLRDLTEDLHLLLLDPDRFLFEIEVQTTENVKLCYRREKLYGRDKEETLITDAFCRVSRGKSEAFFIGGFSGCGKSMLVNTVRARVNAVGGYVIKHKFDDLSRERSLFGVISALNQLCLMLKGSNTPPKVALLVKKLKDEFGADITLLARIVKNVKVLSPEFVSPAEVGGGDTMNARSVGFTLSRFMRVVSSPRHPVMVSRESNDWLNSVLFAFLKGRISSCTHF